MRTKIIKSATLYYVACAIIMFASCARITLKTFVDPSIQSSSLKSIAVFSLRNTSLSPGEALELDRTLTQAFLRKNNSVKFMGAAEATERLNAVSLVDDYFNFLREFEHSGIPNTTILKNIGEKLGVDAILQGTLSDVIQRDGSYPGVVALTSLTCRYTLLSTTSGNILWEGTSSVRKQGVTTFSKAPPLYQVLDLAQKKILTGLPILGK